MRYDGAYKTYKLFSISEQDISVNGGGAASRYINNSVLVFLPDIERPEIGTELFVAADMTAAKTFIDDNERNGITAKEIFADAVLQSKKLEEQRQAQQAADRQQEEDKRRNEIRTAEYYKDEREKY